MTRHLGATVAVGMAMACGLGLYGRGFRGFLPIASPVGIVPNGARRVREPVALPDSAVRDAVRDVMDSWNRGDLAEKLDDSFQDKQRLLDSFDDKVPRDAQTRVLGIEGVRTLGQYYEAPESADAQPRVTSIVSAMVRTQIEYSSPEEGFQRVTGINELILRVVMQPAK